jgi:glucose/arabinose dehydrogenase
MLTRTAVLILTATITLASANRAAAQTAQQSQPAGATATPAQPAMPIMPPPSPTYPTSAPIVNPAVPIAQTAPAPAPATMSDPDLDTAAMMLDRIETLTLTALHETGTRDADKAVVIASDGNSGKVAVDRATLDEIHSLAQQVALMIPAKRQP